MNERHVHVSVTDASIQGSSEPKESKRRLDIAGLAKVNASAKRTYEHLRDFSNLKEVSSFVKVADYNPLTKRLYFVCEAFKYRAVMHLKIDMVEDPEGESLIKFSVVEGVMVGFSGALKVKSLPKFQSTIELVSHYEYLTLPVPKLFVEFGFEVVFQKMAERIRENIESKVRRGK